MHSSLLSFFRICFAILVASSFIKGWFSAVMKLADASDIEVLKKLKIDKTKHIVALANEDDTNLEIAIALKETLKDKETDKDKEVDKKKNGYKKADKKQLYIHLRNRELDKFYKDGGLLDDSSKLELNIFSMMRNSAKALFLKHDIDGETREYIDSDKPFGIVVVGYSELAVEVIKQACELAHFPNENKMTIYCVAKDAAVFQKSHTYHYGNAEQILNIEWQFLSLDYQTKVKLFFISFFIPIFFFIYFFSLVCFFVF